MPAVTPPTTPGPIAAFQQVCLETRGEMPAARTAARATGFLPLKDTAKAPDYLPDLLPSGVAWRPKDLLEGPGAFLVLGQGDQRRPFPASVHGCGVQFKRGSYEPNADREERDIFVRWGKPAQRGVDNLTFVFVGEPRTGGAVTFKRALATQKRTGVDISYVSASQGDWDLTYLRTTRLKGH